MKSLTILGCGWLGWPLALKAVSQGVSTIGTTRSEEKKTLFQENGIQHQRFDAHAFSSDEITTLVQSEVMVVCFPPGLKSSSPGAYIQQVEKFTEAISKFSHLHVVWVSSTSVYPNTSQHWKESDPIEEPNELLRAEQIVQSQLKERVAILRMAGLAGSNRLLARHFAGKKDLANGNSPVNLVHQVDAVETVWFVCQKNHWGEILNVSSPIHPTRAELYGFECQKYGLEKPHFICLPSDPQKIVDSNVLISKFGFTFRFENPFDYTYSFPVHE